MCGVCVYVSVVDTFRFANTRGARNCERRWIGQEQFIINDMAMCCVHVWFVCEDKLARVDFLPTAFRLAIKKPSAFYRDHPFCVRARCFAHFNVSMLFLHVYVVRTHTTHTRHYYYMKNDIFEWKIKRHRECEMSSKGLAHASVCDNWQTCARTIAV